jgi:hypothetical protein
MRNFSFLAARAAVGKAAGMRLQNNESNAGRRDRGLGPFTGAQLTLVIIVLAGVIGFPMIASAVMPNGNTLNACASKKTGALRVIDKSKNQRCAKTETPLTWSKTGPTGARGPSGTNGTPGSARAYAYVQADGTVVAARSKNISVQADTGDAGVYCVNLQNVDPATVAPVVTASDTPLTDGGAKFWTPFLTFDPTILAGEVTSGDCAVLPDFLVIMRNGDPGFVPQDFTISVP